MGERVRGEIDNEQQLLEKMVEMTKTKRDGERESERDIVCMCVCV